MSKPKFVIPAEFEDHLKYEPIQDTRTDEEILGELCQPRPVVSERNIWAFWHSGVRGMHPWNQRNVCSWVRMHPGWTVRVLSNDKDSPEYALNYLTADLLPDVYVKGLMEDEIAFLGPHSSDFVRSAALYEHGGIFADVGVMLVRSVERICWNQLEDPTSPFQVAVPSMFGQTTANHFTASRKGDPLILRWNVLFRHVWEGRSQGAGVISHPLLAQHFQTKDKSIERMDKYNFDVISTEHSGKFADYVAQIFCWERVCRIEDDDGFNCIEYWAKYALIWDCRREDWPAEDYLGGLAEACPKFFDLMSVPLDTDPASELYKEASAVIWHILAFSCMQKIYRGGKFLKQSLGHMFDADQGGHDAKKGTFAELFRWGCENLVQTREVNYEEPARTTVPITTGLLKTE